MNSNKQTISETLKKLPEHLYAILDSARNEEILEYVFLSKAKYEILYDDKYKYELASVGPYLVNLKKNQNLIDTLIHKGWSDHWGIYLTSDCTFEELKEHFQQFLIVQMENNEKLFFRFYDPRVLRVYLNSCTPEEKKSFFGPVSGYYLEDLDNNNMLTILSE